MPFKMVPENKLALNWTYFKKVNAALDGSGLVALTACSMEPSGLAVDGKTTPGSYRVVSEKLRLTVRVTKDSWVVRSAIAKTDESQRLLNHERTHYLLATCVAFELYQQILAVEESSVQALQARLNELRSAAADRVQELSDEYDRETDHGRIPARQKAWDLKIEKWDSEQSE